MFIFNAKVLCGLIIIPEAKCSGFFSEKTQKNIFLEYTKKVVKAIKISYC
jgi:hypothetical protein